MSDMPFKPNFASCCLLSFNRPDFLITAVTTLLEHADSPLELLIHDDGSTDPRVKEVLWRWSEEGIASTVWINPPGHNQGQGIALNRMFNAAKGDPVIKLDQDLIFEPGWLRTVNELLDSNAVAAVDSMEPRIGLLGLYHYYADPVDSVKCKVSQFLGWQSHTHICGSGFAMPRDVFEILGPFEEHSEAFAEDYDMQLRVTRDSRFVCALPDKDLIRNQGFGIGPSTVVVAENTVAKIHKGPIVHG